MTEEEVHLIARKIYAVENATDPWENLTEDAQQYFIALAGAIIAAIDAKRGAAAGASRSYAAVLASLSSNRGSGMSWR
jgi:hypothetical protein